MKPSPGAAKPTIERETATSAVVNGNQCPGMLVAVTAADLAVKKIKSGNGPIVIVGAHNTVTSSGLALVVEVLSGVLGGGAVPGMCESKEAAKSNGHCVIAIDPSALVDNFSEKVESLLKVVKASGTDVRLPGENAAATATARRASGKLPIPARIWES